MHRRGKAGGAHAPGLKARRQASAIVHQVLSDGQFLDDVFVQVCGDDVKGGEDRRDRALVRAIATTTLRRLGEIKAVLSEHMKKPLPPKQAGAAAVLFTAVAQIRFMKVPDRAAIDLAVRQLAANRKWGHLKGMANAVLRKVASDENETDGAAAGQLNTPKWLWQLWVKDYGRAIAGQIAEAHLGEAATDLTLKPDAQHVPDGSRLLPFSLRLPGDHGPVETLDGYEAGDWWVQDFAASLPVALLGDVRGKTVADLCAAPGGKTMQLAAGGARVWAVDNSERRLERVGENLSRTGLAAEIICDDVLNWRGPGEFDAVLLDAPCSATGTLRRHPDGLHLKTSGQIDKLVGVQANMLDHAFSLLAPGGTLVYCVCSLQKREGEQQVSRFLERCDKAERVSIAADTFANIDGCITDDGDLRTLPFMRVGDAGGMDGFFAARLRRKS